jgi:hypothetical protein
MCFAAALSSLAGCGNANSNSNGDGGPKDAGTGIHDAWMPIVDAASDSATALPDSSVAMSGLPMLHGHLAYQVTAPGAQSTVVIYTASLDGSTAPRAVTSVSDVSETPKFSRDGANLYYSHYLAGGAVEVRQVGVDGTNDHIVYGPCPAYSGCYALGEDSTGRVFVWFNTAQAGSQGELYTLAPAVDGGAARMRWAGDPGCSSDAAFSTAGNAIAITTACSPPSLFLGDPAATTPLVGHAIAGVEVLSGSEHVQTAGGRIYMRALPTGAAPSPLGPVHAYSFAPDGTDTKDLNLGDDVGDFVVSDDASFVLASHMTGMGEGGGTKSYSIVAHAGAWRMLIPGLDSIVSIGTVSVAWTAR